MGTGLCAVFLHTFNAVGAGHLIGIATVANFFRQMDNTSAAGIAVRLQGLLRRTPGLTSEKAGVVGQSMALQVFSATLLMRCMRLPTAH
jgi:hypothetical protein